MVVEVITVQAGSVSRLVISDTLKMCGKWLLAQQKDSKYYRICF